MRLDLGRNPGDGFPCKWKLVTDIEYSCHVQSSDAAGYISSFYLPVDQSALIGFLIVFEFLPKQPTGEAGCASPAMGASIVDYHCHQRPICENRGVQDW